jgi:uncharacterized membrane protein YsdA (DUF1294 family)
MGKLTGRQFSILAVVITVAIIIAIFAFTDASNWAFVWWLAWGVTTFLFYGYDKMQARRGGWRVPENVLHLLALIGGWAGGWLGMFLFRHKIRKPQFYVVLAVATVFNLGVYFFVLR